MIPEIDSFKTIRMLQLFRQLQCLFSIEFNFRAKKQFAKIPSPLSHDLTMTFRILQKYVPTFNTRNFSANNSQMKSYLQFIYL